MVVVGGGGLEQFSVSPRPLGFGFGARVWGQGLTIFDGLGLQVALLKLDKN